MSFFSSLFGESAKKTAITSILDMITYASGLASTPRDLDPVLDRMRDITSGLKGDASLTPAHETVLLDVYLEIERYLATRDRVRAYEPESIRSKFSPELRGKIDRHQQSK